MTRDGEKGQVYSGDPAKYKADLNAIAALADELAVKDEHIFVLHRTAKSGLGDAYLAGFDGTATALAALFVAASARAQDRLNVIASFSILGDLLAEVAGDKVELSVVVGPDIEDRKSVV